MLFVVVVNNQYTKVFIFNLSIALSQTNNIFKVTLFHTRRFVPSADLYEIYKEYYGKEVITKDIIEECSTLLFLAWLGEKIAGAKLFKTYAKKSPFLHENLHNYFLGKRILNLSHS